MNALEDLPTAPAPRWVKPTSVAFPQRGADDYARHAHSHPNTRHAREVAVSHGLRQADETAAGRRLDNGRVTDRLRDVPKATAGIAFGTQRRRRDSSLFLAESSHVNAGGPNAPKCRKSVCGPAVSVPIIRPESLLPSGSVRHRSLGKQTGTGTPAGQIG